MKRRFLTAAVFIAATAGLSAQTSETPELRREVRIVAVGGGSYLGVKVEEVTPESVARLRLPGEYGALIQEVLDSTGASGAGLLANDVVIAWNGTRVESSRALRRMIMETPVGRTVRLTIVRNGATIEAVPVIGERRATFEIPEIPGLPDVPHPSHAPVPPEGIEWSSLVPNGGGEGVERMIVRMKGTSGPRIGVMLSKNIDESVGAGEEGSGSEGVEIVEVLDGLGAKEAGLQVGDVIVAVNGKPVNEPDQVRELIHVIGRDSTVTHVTIGYRRGETETSIRVRLDREGKGGAIREHRVLRFNCEPAPEMVPSPPSGSGGGGGTLPDISLQRQGERPLYSPFARPDGPKRPSALFDTPDRTI